MSEQHSLDLATLSIEKDLARNVHLDKVIDEFNGLIKIEKLCCHSYSIGAAN